MPSRETSAGRPKLNRMLTALLLAATLAATPTVKAVDRPEHGLRAVLGDLLLDNSAAGIEPLSEHDRRYIRYLWISPEIATEQERVYPTACWCLHMAATQKGSPENPPLVAGGRAIRLDAREIDPKDPERFLRLFDSLATQDGTFHSLANLLVDDYRTFRVGDAIEIRTTGGWQSATFEGLDGDRIRFRRSTSIETTIGRYVRRAEIVHGGHLGRDELATLVRETHSQCPILPVDFFAAKALTTLDGGLYYEFRKVPGTLDELLTQLNISKKLSEIKATAAKAGIVISGVTGSSRQVVVEQGQSNPNVGGGFLRVTLDLAKGDTAEDQHPLRNLASPRFTASEVIFETESGLHAYFLGNAAGARQDSVPDNIAHDTTIPQYIDGHAVADSRLQCAMSCIRCHGPDNGWKRYSNEVAELLNAGRGPIYDKTIKGRREDIRDRLKTEYSAQHDRFADRARDDFDLATWRISGLNVAKTSALASELVHRYLYAPVTPRRAAMALGYDVPEEHAVDVLQTILGDLEGEHGEPLEDPMLSYLLIGKAMRRADWERAFNEAAMRTREWEKQFESRTAAAEWLTKLVRLKEGVSG